MFSRGHLIESQSWWGDRGPDWEVTWQGSIEKEYENLGFMAKGMPLLFIALLTPGSFQGE